MVLTFRFSMPIFPFSIFAMVQGLTVSATIQTTGNAAAHMSYQCLTAQESSLESISAPHRRRRDIGSTQGRLGSHRPVAPVPFDVVAIEHHYLVPGFNEVCDEALMAVAAGIDIHNGTQL